MCRAEKMWVLCGGVGSCTGQWGWWGRVTWSTKKTAMTKLFKGKWESIFYTKHMTFFTTVICWFSVFTPDIDIQWSFLTDEAPLDHYNHGMKSLSHILLYDVVFGNRWSQTAQCRFKENTVDEQWSLLRGNTHCQLHNAVFLFYGGLWYILIT